MKALFIIAIALGLTACASKTKTDTAATTTQKETTKATETAEAVKTETSKTAKKAKATTATTTTSSDVAPTSGLPAITGTEKSSVTCTNKSDTRKISVLTVAEGGCGVVYNKMGEDKTVAMAKSDTGYCDTVSSKIKTNLEGAGFNCGGTSTSSDQPAQ